MIRLAPPAGSRHPATSAAPRRAPADDPDQVIGTRRFEYVRGRTGFQSAMDVLIASVHGQHDDPRVRSGFADRGDRLETADTGQVQVHQRDVRPIRLEEADSFFPGRGGRDDLHVLLVGVYRDCQKRECQGFGLPPSGSGPASRARCETAGDVQRYRTGVEVRGP